MAIMIIWIGIIFILLKLERRIKKIEEDLNAK